MPTRTLDDDPYAAMTDPMRTRARTSRTRAQADDDPYASLPDTSKPDPWKTPEGVKIVGTNAAGQPIYAPASQPETRGSAASRFLSSAYKTLVEPVKGMYHGLVEGPQNPYEAQVAERGPWGPVYLREKRFLIDPMKSEAHKTAEEYRQANMWGKDQTPDQARHEAAMAGHALATVLPLIGPGAAGAGEQAGTQWASGDKAGALGTGVATVGQYLVPEAAGKLTEWAGPALAKGQVTRMIRPASADLRFGKDPAGAILREGITGNTLEQIGDRTYDRLRVVGALINRIAREPALKGKIVDVSGALKPLDDAMAKAARAGDKNLYGQLRQARNELYFDWAEHTTPAGQTVLRPVGPRNLRMTPYDALQFKRMIGDRIRWTGEPLNGEVNQALGEAYGKTKDAVNTAVPGLKKLNERYSDLVGAAKAIERRLPIEARNAHWSLSDIASGVGGHPVVAAARHVLRWPAVRSRGAKLLHNMPKLVPPRPGLAAAPVVGAGSGHQRLRELQDEADKRKPALAGATY